MKNSGDKGFSARLREAAAKRGLTSGRSKSGVDVVEMARVIGASYEMARRYAEGLATPKAETVRLIADWLHVDPSWLMYGEGKPTGKNELNTTLLEECISAVVEAQKSAGTTLSADRQAQLVAALYQSAVAGVHPRAATVAATLRALST